MNNHCLYVAYDGEQVLLSDLLQDYARLREKEASYPDDFEKHALEAARSDEQLKPYQANCSTCRVTSKRLKNA